MESSRKASSMQPAEIVCTAEKSNSVKNNMMMTVAKPMPAYLLHVRGVLLSSAAVSVSCTVTRTFASEISPSYE